MTFIKLIQELSLMVKETPSPHYSKIAVGSTTNQTGSACEVWEEELERKQERLSETVRCTTVCSEACG